jgi:hypothetical protein
VDGEPLEGQVVEEESEESSRDPDHQGLGEELTDHAQTARSKGGANGDFPLSGGGPGQQEVGYVRARDQQHARYHEQHQVGYHPRYRRKGTLGVGHGVSADFLVQFGELRLQPAHDGPQLGVGRATGDALPEVAPYRQNPAPCAGERGRIVSERSPGVFHDSKAEALGHDADDDGGLAVHTNAASQDVPVRCEPVVPGVEAQQKDVGGAGQIVPLLEGAPQNGGHGKTFEGVGGHEAAQQALRWLVVPGEVQRPGIAGSQAAEDRLSIPNIEVVMELKSVLASRWGVS